MREDCINLLVTIDRKYIDPLVTMLRSYAETNPNVKTNLYIAHSELKKKDFTSLQESVCAKNILIHDIKVTEHWFTDIPVLERLPEESFYRLLAFHILPKDVERCLYLDPDIIIRKSLLPLYNIEFGENYIAAASHMHGGRDNFNKARLGIRGQERYINSGVMLMNLKQIRQDFTVEAILECLEESVQSLLLGDQDMVNILFGRNTLFLPEEIYNLDERTLRYFSENEGWTIDTVAEQTAIIHYNGKCKPWLEEYKGELDCFYPKVTNKGPAPTGVIRKHIKSFFNITRLTKQQTIVVVGAILFAAVCLISYATFGTELLKILAEPTLFREWLGQFGVFDELIFILTRAAQTVVKFIPAEPLEIASGYAWGAVPGMLYCVIGNMIGTVVIFALTRKYGKKILNLFLPVKNMKLMSVLEGSDKIYWLLFFLYLIPGSPKDGFTYFVGLLPVKLLPFMVVTFIARMPSVLSSTLCGSSLAEKQYWIAILIFIATIVLAVAGAWVYNRYVKRREKQKR